MRTVLVLLAMCGVAAAADDFDHAKLDATLNKMSSHSTSMGTVPVKYHEQYGPYKLWVMISRDGFSNFEARFVTIKNGAYVFGLDAPSTGVTKTKQMYLFAVPMRRFNLQAQEEFRKEFQRRQRDLKEKRITYPEPPPEVAKAPVAKPAPEKPTERPRWAQSYRRINGKLVPVDTPLNQAAIDEVKRDLEKNAPKPAKATP